MVDLNYQKRKNIELFKSLEDSKSLFLSKTQNYIPIYKRFFELNDTNWNSINLNNKWYISNINEKIEDNSRLYNCRLKNLVNNKSKDKEVFLDPKITLTQISVALSIPIKDLSYIINNHFEVHFNDFINQYRVDHFAKMLNEDYLNNYTIDALIKKAGFSSKSTFHAAFKKIHNCTPSQYLASKKAIILT